MSTASSSSQVTNRRINALQQSGRPSRRPSSSKNSVTQGDAYSYALRTAYLHHLLLPKLKRRQHVANALPRPPLTRQSSSVADLLKDFSHVRDTKSNQFPKGFMGELDKRIAGVIMGQERLPEYSNDQVLKSVFGSFLHKFKEPHFRGEAEKDRRPEILILKFWSNATTVVQKGKVPQDETVEAMVDRHVALFVRLITATLKSHDRTKDKLELVQRLNTLEEKLLRHDRDLAADSQRNGGHGGVSFDVEVPRSGDVKDMHLVQIAANLFDKSFAQVQLDLDEMKDLWTEKAALQDVQSYQSNLDLNTKRTLQQDDFDTEEGYEHWRGSELPELAQMMNTIIQSTPSLAQNASNGALKPQTTALSSSDMNFPDQSGPLAGLEDDSSYVFSQPVDMSALNLGYDNQFESEAENTAPYTFIPPDPRLYYKKSLDQILSHHLHGSDSSRNGDSAELPHHSLLSQRALELLRELAYWWRIPPISRLMLFLDVAREKFLNQEMSIEMLDVAFQFFKDPPPESKITNIYLVFDRHNWTMKDIGLNQQILSSLHEAILRDLFEELLKCFDKDPPAIIPMMAVLDDHIYSNPWFSKSQDAMSKFASSLENSLERKAGEIYMELAQKHIGQQQDSLEFYHVIQLGKEVIKLTQRMKKRYRNIPDVMGVQPFVILVRVVLPAYSKDARNQISSILHRVQLQGEEIQVLDGFDLYRDIVEIRRIHSQELPGVEFVFQIENLLEQFVWRWISSIDGKILEWVDGSVKQDQFQVRDVQDENDPTPEDRHSVSVIDVFNAFRQSLDKIIDLHWEDKYQHAKFMTAMAKAFGGGVARYCELIEHKFFKEMDRLTPEREAQLGRTRQEKWMQMARDTISGREKIEPFQFLPESFVKLNNIGYAMLRLDALEKLMDADACASTIHKQEPPPPLPRQRKAENLVFTIKIIEAEDLKAGDLNGLSDPYVVLGDKDHKRLAKTRTVYETLNPRWDETIDITTQGPLNIVATVWDWDYMGDHDCLGRTTMKLDPQAFRDFRPHEIWLELDTQGRLLVRVSMEGEKDDIQFYFGKAFRVLKRTERDMTRKITDKLSAYIQHCLSRRTLKSMTTKSITISSVTKLFHRAQVPQSPSTQISREEVAKTLQPLFVYFDENFTIMKLTLTESAMMMVMTRLWKEVLNTVESLLVPPLSDKPSSQRQLDEQELDIVFKWLGLLYDFFHHVDEEDPTVVHGIPLDVLKSPKYQDLQNLNYFYHMPTDDLISTSERMASANAQRNQQAQTSRAPGIAGLLAPPVAMAGGRSMLSFSGTAKRSKSIMLNRNLGTIRKAKEDKRREAQAELSDDVVLRILRMRPEAARYLKTRSKQKQRLAETAAAALMFRQSLNGIGPAGGR